MTKKRRNTNRPVDTGRRKAAQEPDDYFRHGPFEIARFGTLNILKNNMSSEQFAQWQAELAAAFPKVCLAIDAKISRTVEIVKRLPPELLLQRAYWEMAMRHLGMKSESGADRDDALSLRMVDYVQSIVAAVPPAATVDDEVPEQEWQELRTLVGDLFSTLNLDYAIRGSNSEQARSRQQATALQRGLRPRPHRNPSLPLLA